MKDYYAHYSAKQTYSDAVDRGAGPEHFVNHTGNIAEQGD